jgi:hypothetical protein
MPSKLVLAALLGVLVCSSAVYAAGEAEIFAKGSLSRSYLSAGNAVNELSLSGGLAFGLIKGVRLEGRYTNISSLQDRLDVVNSSLVGSLFNIATQTAIYSIGLDIDFLDERAAFQPYIYVGVGYVRTTQSYYFGSPGSNTTTFVPQPDQTGVSANGGIGFRLRIAQRLALELEVFAYAMDVNQPDPLINYIATAGLRVFL